MDNVIHAIDELLGSDGENGYDELLDSLNEAFDADAATGRDMGREDAHAALELLDEEADWDDVRPLLEAAKAKRLA